MQLLETTVALLLGGLFAVAVVHKTRHWQLLVGTLRDLGATAGMAAPLAVSTIAAETMTPVLLAIPATRHLGFAAALVLLVSFNVVVLIAIRQPTPPPCNCFRTTATAMGWPHFARNAALAVGAVTALTTAEGAAPLGPAAAATCVAFAATALLVLVFFDDLVDLLVAADYAASAEVAL
jgi:hypothetical protein